MNNDKKKNKQGWIVPIIVIVILFSSAIFMAQKRKGDLRNSIHKNTGYSIGTVTKYIGGHGGGIGKSFKVLPSDPSIWIEFKVNNSKENTQSKGLLRSDMEGCVGKNYIVIYDTLNPENCILLFNYPINDSLDFIRFTNDFKASPPDLGR